MVARNTSLLSFPSVSPSPPATPNICNTRLPSVFRAVTDTSDERAVTVGQDEVGGKCFKNLSKQKPELFF